MIKKLTQPTGLVLTSCLLFYCLDYYFRISPSLIVQQLMTQYHITTIGIGSFASAFYLGYVISQLPGGVLLDRLRLNPLLIATVLIATLGFVMFLYGHHFWSGMILRFIIGLFSALSFISILYIARIAYPTHFSFIAGIAIAGGTLMGSFAQVIAAHFMTFYPWQWVMMFIAALALLICVVLALPRSQVQLTTLVKTPVRSLLQQMWGTLRKPILLANGIMGGLYYLPTSLFAAVWGISLLMLHNHLTRLESSYVITGLFFGWAVGSPIFGYLGDRITHHHRYIGVCAIAAAVVSVMLIHGNHFSYSIILLLGFLFGLLSSAQTLVWKIFSLHCPESISGTGIAVTNMVIMFTGSVFQYVTGWILHHYNPNSQHLIAQQLTKGLIIIPIIFVLAGLLGFMLPYFESKSDR